MGFKNSISRNRFKGSAAWKVAGIISFFLLSGCTGEDASACLRSSGDIMREEWILPAFERITVNEGVRLVIRYGPVQEVILETGENLKEDIDAKVEAGRLYLYNRNSCNLFRKYGITTFYITVPDLVEIRSNTGFPIQSDGVLPFQELTLFSESFSSPETETTDGSFELDLQVQTLRITANGIAYFEIRGNAETVQLTIGAGDARIDTRELRTQHITVNHRGSNDMLVYPILSLEGVIRGPGNVISYNRPERVDVDLEYRGQLLYAD